MPITIGSNITSLRAQRELSQGTDALSRVFERLSSGQRINRASDDAAGLAIADSLRADARITNQAIRNANDGISMLSIAEGALNELSSIVTRITELAEQSANGVYSATQRTALDKEAQSLNSEFDRIIATTSFNGLSLLNTSSSKVALQLGVDGSESSRLTLELESPVTTVVGDGTFGSETIYNLSAGASYTDRMRSVDINNDGNLDLFWSSTGVNPGYALGNGDGTFKAAVSVPSLGNQWNGYYFGDFNGDGNPDILRNSPADGFGIHIGDGAGNFAAGITVNFFTPASSGRGWNFADFNGDGNLDITAYEIAADVMRIALGNGNGTFLASVSYADLPGAGGLSSSNIGDINEDGILDVVFGTIGSGNNLQAYLGNGDGSFSIGTTFVAIHTDGTGLVDVNNDGYLDLIGSGSAAGTALAISLGNGNGTFTAERTYQDANYLNGDLNGDGFVDSVGTRSGAVYLALNNGNGTFTAATSRSASNDYSIALGDFNNDGVSDVITGSSTASTISVFLTDTSEIGGLPTFSLATQADARATLDITRSSLADISDSLMKIGAYQSRLQVATQSLGSTYENVLAAEARIRDTDIAQDAAELTRVKILQQAGAAILAQANSQPAIALKLLRI